MWSCRIFKKTDGYFRSDLLTYSSPVKENLTELFNNQKTQDWLVVSGNIINFILRRVVFLLLEV